MSTLWSCKVLTGRGMEIRNRCWAMEVVGFTPAIFVHLHLPTDFQNSVKCLLKKKTVAVLKRVCHHRKLWFVPFLFLCLNINLENTSLMRVGGGVTPHICKAWVCSSVSVGSSLCARAEAAGDSVSGIRNHTVRLLLYKTTNCSRVHGERGMLIKTFKFTNGCFCLCLKCYFTLFKNYVKTHKS